MTAKKIFYAIFFLLVLLFAFSSCTGGAELCRVEGNDYIYVLYGSPNAITKISVLDSEGGEVSSVEPSYRVNEPWLSQDKEDYGFAVCDLNGDGLEDFTVKTVRTEGAEKYLFYLNKGDGNFKLEKDLSGVVAPMFGDGTISFRTRDRIEQPTYTNEPPVYELRENEYVYGWSEHGRLQVQRLNRYSYFSETDIYCYAIYLPNEDGELEVDSQKWIYPEKLSEYGLEPLE